MSVSGDISNVLTESYPVDQATFEVYEMPSEDVVEGKPHVESATLHASEDGTLLIGLARITAGTIRVQQPADEVDYVRQGHIVITSDRDDTSVVAKAGSVVRLTKGVTYTKQIVEDYEELFVVFTRDGSTIF